MNKFTPGIKNLLEDCLYELVSFKMGGTPHQITESVINEVKKVLADCENENTDSQQEIEQLKKENAMLKTRLGLTEKSGQTVLTVVGPEKAEIHRPDNVPEYPGMPIR